MKRGNSLDKIKFTPWLNENYPLWHCRTKWPPPPFLPTTISAENWPHDRYNTYTLWKTRERNFTLIQYVQPLYILNSVYIVGFCITIYFFSMLYKNFNCFTNSTLSPVNELCYPFIFVISYITTINQNIAKSRTRKPVVNGFIPVGRAFSVNVVD